MMVSCFPESATILHVISIESDECYCTIMVFGLLEHKFLYFFILVASLLFFFKKVTNNNESIMKNVISYENHQDK